MHVGLKISFIFSTPPPFLQPQFLYIFPERALLVGNRLGNEERFKTQKHGQCFSLLSSLCKVETGAWQIQQYPKENPVHDIDSQFLNFLKQDTSFQKVPSNIFLSQTYMILEVWKDTHLLQTSQAWWPSHHLSHLWLLIYCTRILTSPQLQ